MINTINSFKTSAMLAASLSVGAAPAPATVIPSAIHERILPAGTAARAAQSPTSTPRRWPAPHAVLPVHRGAEDGGLSSQQAVRVAGVVDHIHVGEDVHQVATVPPVGDVWRRIAGDTCGHAQGGLLPGRERQTEPVSAVKLSWNSDLIIQRQTLYGKKSHVGRKTCTFLRIPPLLRMSGGGGTVLTSLSVW